MVGLALHIMTFTTFNFDASRRMGCVSIIVVFIIIFRFILNHILTYSRVFRPVVFKGYDTKNDDKPFVFGGNSTGNKSKLGEKSIQSKSPSIELGEQKFKNARERALAYAKKVANRNNRRLGVKGMTKAKQRAKIANKENN